MKNSIALCLLVVLLGFFGTSCGTTYPRPVFATFAKTPAPLKVFKSIEKNRVNACTMFQNAIIEIKGKGMAAIGLCSYDINRGYIAVSLISTTGIKLIEVAEFNGKRRQVFAMSDIANGDKAANRIADDVKRIYIQPTGPPQYLKCSVNSVLFIWSKGKIRNELRLGHDSPSNPIVLQEKKIFLDNELEGAVFYYDYKDINGKQFPMRIRYENYKYNYNLTLKNKEVVDSAQPDKK